MSNRVDVTTNRNQITVVEGTNTLNITKGDATLVEVRTEGPQGASFPFNDDNKVNESIIYYDNAAGTYVADSKWTTNTITDGGNF